MKLQVPDEAWLRIIRSLGMKAQGPLSAACCAVCNISRRSSIAPAQISTQLPPPPPQEDFIQQRRMQRAGKKRRFCRFGCCCDDTFSTHGVEPVLDSVADVGLCEEIHFVRAAAAVDGCRAAAYIDSHCHLECVLQIVRTRERVTSLSKKWRELTREERSLWRILGWTRTQFDNEHRLDNPIWYRAWDSLSSSELAAARALGWDHDTWNGREWPLPRNVDWEDLSEEVRLHLTALGETVDSWTDMFDKTYLTGAGDGGDGREWAELSEEETAAASQLGFTEPTFNVLELGDVDFYVDNFCGSGFDACITSGCDDYSLADAIRLTLSHPKVFGSFGCHPKTAWLYDDAMERSILEAFSSCGRKAIAWGEMGLDYSMPYWGCKAEYRYQQQRVLERQLKLALERDLPVVLHIRNGDEDYGASQDSLQILRRCLPSHYKGHVHGNHDPELVKVMLSEWPNFFFGLTGTVTMGGSGPGTGVCMAHVIPLERMLLETDAPFIVPRGTVFNHVGQIPHIARSIAELRGWSAHDILKAARANTRFVYGI